jgi:6-phosphogluconate dehydrogenase
MLALITMERPASFDAPALRRARADILRTLVRPSERDVMATSVRAQYDGYRAIRGAGPDSNTETYFKVRAALSSPRWRGTDITLESGKRMGERKKEIVITFKHPAPCMCPAGGEHLRNKIVIALEPEERITIHFWSKKPGFAYDLEERMLTFMLRGETHRSQYVEEYKKLLLDCITGDQTLFVSTDEVYHMWRFTDGITDAWENNAVPLGRYTPDTSCIAESGVPPQGTTAPEAKDPAREIGFVGLGKMGRNMAEHLAEQGWRVAAYDRSAAATAAAAERGITAAGNMRGLVSHLSAPRLVWLMIPAGRAVDEALFGAGGLASLLSRGDTVIDGGNSFYGDTMKRAKKLAARGIRFLDVGVSGGPEGARHGAALMIGGDGEDFARWEHLFRDLAGGRDYVHTGKSGAGHFAKMVHNGIEYGMMQSLAEGFAILKKAPFGFDLKKIAEAYNNGSVIESRLVGWLARAYEAHGEDLKGITGAVGHSGEGEWTAQTAKKLRVPAPVIADAFDFRVRSKKKPSYTGRILSALRNQFGGHSVQ